MGSFIESSAKVENITSHNEVIIEAVVICTYKNIHNYVES